MLDRRITMLYNLLGNKNKKEGEKIKISKTWWLKWGIVFMFIATLAAKIMKMF